MRVDFDRRILRDALRNDPERFRSTLTAAKPSFLSSVARFVDLAIEKNRPAHKDRDRSGTNEPGLVRSQIRSVTFDRMRWTCETGRVHRRRRCSSRATAGYVRGLQAIMKPLALEASYYGHAASGLLHVRPVLNLHSPADLKTFRQVADETSALVREFKGSLSAEHGVGIARTEYMREQLGDELLESCARSSACSIQEHFQSGKNFRL